MNDPLDPLARNTDPDTSHTAADALTTRADHCRRLLAIYARGGEWTDENACAAAGLVDGGWKRCSDLRRFGWIARTGTAISSANRPVMTCAITTTGFAEAWRKDGPGHLGGVA